MPAGLLDTFVNKKSTISSRTFKAGRSPNDERNRLKWKPFSMLASVAMLLNLEFMKPDPRIGISSGARIPGDWIRFPPVHFGPEENVIWSTEVAPGHSSPCIAGKRLFLTSFDTENSTVSVDCFDRMSGEHLWSTPFHVEALEKGHPSFNPASSSPCCDAENVLAYFGSYGLVCLDHEGKLIWEQRLPTAKSFGGNATSPMLYEDRVILYRGNYVDHYIVCFDKSYGRELRKVQQTEKFTGRWLAPLAPSFMTTKSFAIPHAVFKLDIESGDRLWIAIWRRQPPARQ